jgi:hypothetical protein
MITLVARFSVSGTFVQLAVRPFEINEEETMNTQTRLARSLGILTVILVAAVLAVSVLNVRGNAAKNPGPSQLGSGAIGVGPGQFVRLSATNVFGDTAIQVDFTVMDATANTVLTALPPQPVEPGGTAFFDFSPGATQGLSEIRTLTQVQGHTAMANGVAPCVQVIDSATQKMQVFISGTDFITTTTKP